MTSSRSGSRRFIWLAVAIVAAIVLYTLGWNYAAQRLTSEAESALQSMAGNGDRANCENIEARGYPFRIGLFCDSVFVERRIDGFTFAAGELRSAAQIYAPRQIVAELDSPARLTAPGILPLELKWDGLRASARLTTSLPERLSLVATALSASVDAPGEIEGDVLKAGEFQLHLQPVDSDVELGIRLNSAVGGAALPGPELPPVSGVADIMMGDGIARLASRDFTLRGGTYDIRRLELAFEGGGTISVTGPLTVDQDGLIDATLDIRTGETARLMEVFAEAYPQLRSQLTALSAGLTALGPDQSLPLKIRKGVAIFGFIELGMIPPL
ncbi:MAG: DUF2125 domain-containing protein [Rhizobiaceae bacterium]|nr:DUF2125 domain-containing protein [Rhizobiaceae bacterium]